jgi:hypothetical protein
MKNIDVINAIERVIEKRQQRGATDESIVKYLLHLRTVWKNNSAILQFIDAILPIFKEEAITMAKFNKMQSQGLEPWNGKHIKDVQGHIDMAISSCEKHGLAYSYCLSGDLMVTVCRGDENQYEVYVSRMESSGKREVVSK